VGREARRGGCHARERKASPEIKVMAFSPAGRSIARLQGSFAAAKSPDGDSRSEAPARRRRASPRGALRSRSDRVASNLVARPFIAGRWLSDKPLILRRTLPPPGPVRGRQTGQGRR